MVDGDGVVKILVVDDDPAARRATAEALRGECGGRGCEVVETGDGDEALALLVGGGGEYDCAFLEYRLRGRDGLGVLREARGAGVQTPVVILTGEGSEELAVAMMKAGAADYLVKGRATAELLGSTLRHVVRLREAESRLAAAQARHWESEERFRRLVEVAEDGVWVVDADGRTTFVNAGAAAIIGYRPEEIVGRSPLEFMDEASRVSTAEGLRRRRQGFRERRECVMRHRDGSPVWVIVAAAPLTGPGGEYRGAFAVLTDVSRQKRTERALRESEERFRKVFEDGPVGMAMTGLDRRMIAVNAAFGRLVGRDPGALAGLSFEEITHPEDLARNADFVERVRREEVQSYRLEKRYVRPDGTVVWAALTSSLVRDAGGRPAYMVTIVEDVTERRRAEAELRASEARFRSLFEASPLAISLSVGETTLYANPAYLRMFGYDGRAGEVVGRPLTERVSPAYRREVMDRLARQEAEGAEQDAYEAVGRRRDGTEFPYHVSVARMRVAEGMANLAFITDLTEPKRAEGKLRESEERFRKIFEDGPTGMALVGLDHRIITTNLAFARMIGRGPAELAGVRFEEITHPDDVARDVEQAGRLGRGEISSYRMEKRYQHTGGGVVWAALTVSVIRDAGGRPAYMLGMVEDITERRRAEEELRASEARFRSLFEASPLGVELSVDGVSLYVNPAYLQMFGFGRAEDVVGRSVTERVSPSVRGMIAERIARRDRGERVPEAYETVGLRQNGEEFPLHLRITRMAVAEGVAHLAFLTDLSEQKRAEAALNQTSRTLEAVFAASPLAIAVLDRAGVVRMWNPAAERMFGWAAEEAVGQLFPLLRVSDDPDQFDDLYHRLLQGHAVEGIEGAQRRKDGTMVEVSASAAPLKAAEDGTVTGIVVVCADMTEPNRLREQLSQAQKMESLGRLAGGIAHDFNNLLAVIGGYAESLGRRIGEGHPGRGQVDEIERAAERGVRLVKQLLAFSRSRPVRPQRVDLGQVVTGVCEMLRQVIGEGIEIDRKTDGRPAVVNADPGQVEQMLVNLALNARDAMPEGGTLTFGTRHVEGGASGRCVALTVADTGKGMDAAVQSRIFEPFFTTKGEGTGLGLSIVYGIVRQLGGRVSVESAPGRGTRFEILLPGAGEA